MFDLQAFKQPASPYRVHPFWFWNGEMEDEQIRHQIREMADKGVGGFFICARQGLKVPYLSDSWFAKVRVAVEAAREHGLHAWLYDEYPYPSGIAGGEVTLEHPEAKHYTLVHRTERASGGQRLTLELPWARILYAKAVPVTPTGERIWQEAVDIRSRIGNYQAEPIFQKAGLTAYNQKRFFTYRTIQKLDWEAPDGEWDVLIVQEEEIGDFKYYGTFVDPCNREAMSTFIRLTHERYAEHLSEYFGTTIKGMFTDEIGLLGSVPWSPQLADFFLEQHGYDLREHLHALVYADEAGTARIRYDYYQAIHLLLLDSYHKQVHDWCEAHGLEYVTEVPSVRHTTQLYSHVPGGDTGHEKLGRSLDWILQKAACDFRYNAKMTSSITRQLDRPRNLIECFHSVGWSMTLQDAKWMIDRLGALGTNFYNFHAFFYTLDGLTKHDAPPSQFLQNPYWQHFRKLGDYTGRISYAMSQGEADISIALLQPTTSLWSLMGNPFHGFSYGGNDPKEQARLEALKRWWGGLGNALIKSDWDYDELDAGLLADAVIDENRLAIGRARYQVLLMPPLTNLEGAAWRTIRAFLEAGGTVISLGQLPYEQIDELDPRSPDIYEAFGLDKPVSAAFWKAEADGSEREQELSWSRGTSSAYYLPFDEEADQAAVENKLMELLDDIHPASVKLLPASRDRGLLTQVRRLSPGQALYFVSNQEEREHSLTLRVEESLWKEDGAPSHAGVEFQELSLDDGEAVTLQTYGSAAAWEIPVKLAPYESRLILINRTSGTNPAKTPNPEPLQQLSVDASVPWELRALNDNALRLDTFRLEVKRTDGERLFIADHVPVKTFIDQCADLAEAHMLPVQMSQLFGTPMRLAMSYPLHARYTASLTISGLVPEQVKLVADQSALSGSWSVVVNGSRLQPEDFQADFLYDHRNQSASVSAYLQTGENEIAVEVEIGHDWDGLVDAIYVTGPFEVRADEVGRAVLHPVAARHVPLTAGPYPGHPYYAGKFSFERTLELSGWKAEGEFELTLGSLDTEFHESAEVLVNGRSLGVRAWSPYRWKGESGWLRDGENRVEVRVTNTLIGLLEGKYFHYASHELKPVNP
ncbi:glycosyl hydrolase [Paenibacillus puerhi]|uniref:glycosyl hydrolase n=1 Tax=Paenibacillus puerhi TaxID=2692622 RepID=UPI00135C552A|nr:glycosyl hydrolase [Paenibacillus puerhi]